MTKERYQYYQNEIQRLREIDTKISARVRATYSIEKKSKNKSENRC
jgi:hypothetical protein